MLVKNVYIVYPAGYSGNYVNWAINISDTTQYQFTTKNSVNQHDSNKYGSAGTSHLHHRIPTHQGVDQVISWIAHHRPNEKKIYVINPGNDRGILQKIMSLDPTGVIIWIHHDNDLSTQMYGSINCITKWNVWLKILHSKILNGVIGANPLDQVNMDWSPTSILQRNFIVDNYIWVNHQSKIDWIQTQRDINQWLDWYTIRNQHNPHEVNDIMYPQNWTIENRIFELSCKDICAANFPQWLENFLLLSQVSDRYDCSHVKQHHWVYSQAQVNLQWFDSFDHWQKTGELDQYLCSHCGIQAMIILNILANSHVYLPSMMQRNQWFKFYSEHGATDWPMPAPTETYFYTLSDKVREEILQKGYKVAMSAPPNPKILNLDWKNLSIHEINDTYQNCKSPTKIIE